MSKIKLEVGKSYRTREEGKVVIKSYVGSHVAYPYRGSYIDGSSFTYKENGTCGLCPSPYDIIAEYKDEPKFTLGQPISTYPKGGASHESILQEAQRLINSDRAEAYGDAKTMFDNIAKGWSVIAGKEISGKQVALMMAWLKICRENNKGRRDNIVDIAGYAALIEKL